MTVLVASWNLQNLSNKKKEKELNIIADEFKKYDLIAVQEIRDKNVAEKLGIKTGMNFILSNPVGSETSGLKGVRKEFYGFFWNTKISLLSAKNVKAENVFTRTPFAGYFKANNFDFVLVNIHVVWGKAVDRKKELAHLSDLVKTLEKNCGTEKDLILCGDFNSELYETENWLPALKAPDITNIHGKLYDNFWVPKDTKYIKKGVSQNFDSNFKNISDHYPIFIEFIDVDNDADTEVKLDFNMEAKISNNKNADVYSFKQDLKKSYEFLFPDKEYFDKFNEFIFSLPKSWREKRFEIWKKKKYDIFVKDI